MAPNVLLLRGDRTPDADFGDAVSPQFQRQVARELGDRYRIGEVIGVGSMGVVFRGEQKKTARDVAIKVALPLLAPEQRARFCREAEIGKRFDHPHCVRVEDFEVSGKGIDYMVMPLVRGRPLAERLGTRQPVEVAVSWGMQLLRGLEHIHQHRIVHRDLKPANILIEDGEGAEAVLRIADYGLAKPMLSDESSAMSVLSRDTMTGLMAGSPAYMAPEQAMALGCDVRSDLYAVGLVLYEIVTGGLPRGEDDAFDQMRARLTEDVSLLLSFAPAPFARIVGKLLRARPDERYASAREALEDIEAFAQGRPLPHAGRDALAPPPMAASIDATGPQRTIRSLDATGPTPAIAAAAVADHDPPRRRSLVPLVVLFGLAAIGIAGWMWWDAERKASTSASDDGVVREHVATPAPAPAVEPTAAPEPVTPTPAVEPAALPSVVQDEPAAEPRVEPRAEPRTDDRSRRASKRRDKSSKPSKPSKPAPKATPAAPAEPAPASTTPTPAIPRAPLLQDGLRKPGKP